MGDFILPMVNSTTGAMNSLLHKLTPMETHGESFLLENLEGLNDAFDKLGQRMVRDALVNKWMLQAREVTYEIEDWIDGSLTHPWKPAVDFWFSEVDDQVEEFNGEIQYMLDRCKRYNLITRIKEEPSSKDAGLAYAVASKITFIVDATQKLYEKTPCFVAIDPRLLYGEAPYLVGIDEQREKIVDIVMDEKQHRKVVALVGTGGIGKTTLAKEIYRHLQGRFDCGAFVCLGRNPCVKTILISILNQAYPSWQSDMDLQDVCCTAPWDEQKLTDKLWAHLKTKSYFVVLDDVRNVWTWKRISCAFPNNGNGESARILITARVKNVAESCCIHPSDVVHYVSRLAKDDSKKLFDDKISASGNNSLPDDYKEMCGGIPIAIAVTIGLISWKGQCVLPKFQEMRTILEMSFDDLSLPVKSCLLYLSVFPENHTIKKDRLIRRWIAEGFVPKRDDKSLLEIGNCYFNELIRRRLIQPAFDNRVDDKSIGCTVPGVVLDFIVSLSVTENFVTANAELSAQVFPCGWIRRFCLHCSDEDEADSWRRLHLSRVRSLSFSGNARRMPDVGALKLVRVLDLEDTQGLEYTNLQSIAYLSLLRYLGLAGTDVINLPEQVMALEQLATMDLRRSRVGIFLLEFRNTELVTVLADRLVIRRGMLAMQKLEELSKVHVGFDGSYADDVTQLVKQSRGLRMLGVRFVHFDDQIKDNRWQVKRFLEEVGKSNLQSFLVENFLGGLLDLLVDSWAHKSKPHNLQKFELRIHDCLPLVPHTIAFLMDLTHLHIKVLVVEQEGVCTLGSLPNLVLLNLHSKDTGGRLTVSCSNGFPYLKVFWYCGHYNSIQFQAGAMPQLRRLGLCLHDRKTEPMHNDLNFGIQHLSCLVQICATIESVDALTALRVEANIKGQASQNHNHPGLELTKRPDSRQVCRNWRTSDNWSAGKRC